MVNSTLFEGGKGGYSVGTGRYDKNTVLYVFVGQKGSLYNGSTAGCASATFNGGGKGCASQYYIDLGPDRGGSGGGGTDIRIASNSLYARVIVAGGGGGGHTYNTINYNGHTGYGGGLSGEDGSLDRNDSSMITSGGGTQTSGGRGGRGWSGYGYAEAGSFGKGGNSLDSAGGQSCRINSVTYSCWLGSGGGGGWYGGGGGGHFSGGGGSGYVFTSSTVSNYPSGRLIDSSYYLTSASTTAGNQSFKSPSGTNETGHSGNGYARITYLGTSI